MFSEYFQSEIPGRLVINSLVYKHAFVRSKERGIALMFFG